MMLPQLLACLAFSQQFKLETNGQSIEVLGLGRMKDGIFEGWNVQGHLDADLSETVTSALAKLGPRTRERSLAPGRNIRYFVVRHKSTSPERHNLNLGVEGGSSWQVRLRSRTVMEGGTTTSDVTMLHCVEFEKNTKDARVVLTDYGWVDLRSSTMSSKLGTKFSVRKAVFRLSAINKEESEEYGSRWEYRVTVLKTDDLDVTLWPLSKDGSPFGRLDKSGRPETQPRRTVYNPIPQQGQDPDAPLVPTGILRAGGGMGPMMNFSVRKLGTFSQSLQLDPQNVARFHVSAAWSRTVELGRVPLDPKAH